MGADPSLDRSSGSLTFPPQDKGHTNIDRAAPTIIDCRSVQYLWLRSMGQDTQFKAKDPSAQLIQINEQLDAMQPYDSLKELADPFPTCKDRIKKDVFDSATLVDNPQDLKSEEDIILKLPSIVGEGSIHQILYEIDCGNDTEANSALISLIFNSEEPEEIESFNKSPNKNINWYRYLMTAPGINTGTITFSIPKSADLESLKIKLWKQPNQPISLKSLVFRTAQ